MTRPLRCMPRLRTISAAAVLMISAVSSAGGSDEPVTVKAFHRKGQVDYTLIVLPRPTEVPGYKDPFLGHCKELVIRGSFKRLRGSFRSNPHVTREKHLAALAFLDRAVADGGEVMLGWMGTGFARVDATKPCELTSRALSLFVDDGKTAVVSFHDAT